MEKLFEDLEMYIQERLDNNYGTFRKDMKLQNLEKENRELYHSILGQINQGQKEQVQQLNDTYTDIRAIEQRIAYHIGLVDGVMIKDYLYGTNSKMGRK